MRGTFWNVCGRYSYQILKIGVTAILSRLLSPGDFGIMAMVLVLSRFMSIFSEAALGPAIIQYQDLDHRDLSSICWFGIFLGLLMAVLLVVCSSPIAMFYKTPSLKPVAMVISSTFLFSAMGIVPSAILQKQLDFKPIALIRFISSVVASMVAICLAMRGAGYWALVFENISFFICNSALLFYFANWFPQFSFQLEAIKKVYGYSRDISLFSAINYWARNMDNLLIGKFLGSSALGYYSHAYNLMLVPLSMITQIITPVLHPVLASIQENTVRMRMAYLRVLKFISTVCFPLMGLMALFAPEIVHTLWGKQWGASIPVFQILAVVGLIQPLVSTSGSVFQACNRTDMLLKLGTINAAIICIGIACGLSRGISGVAVGYSIGYGLIVIPTMYIVIHRILEGSLRELWGVIRKPAFMATCILFNLIVWSRLFKGILKDPLYLLLGGIWAGLVFLIVLGILDRPFCRELCELLPRKDKLRSSVLL